MSNKFKDTLLIGQTDFDMRANLNQKEPKFEQFWLDNQIYNKKMKLNENKKVFVLHDGPPYANGDLHIGHALNKTLKDFIIRYKNATGYFAPFIMGWDTHGLPIESAITKMGVDRKAMDSVSFRQLCYKYALEQVQNQANQFNRLGMFTDYETKYVTLTHDFEMSELRLFEKMYQKGLVYKDAKPIYWSPSSETALADSEIIYKDVTSPSIYVGCDVVNSKEFENTQLIIWTTTPWSLPSNQLIAVGEKIKYSLIEVENLDKKFILASDLLNQVSQNIGWENVKVLKEFDANKLVGLNYVHPLYDQIISKVVLGHHVTSESGSGLVHVATGFGEDDFLIGKQNNIKPFAPIDNQGKFDDRISDLDPELVGMFYLDTNKIITKRLEQSHKLLKLKFLTHSYPHDWRTKQPVLYRCTLQWFVNLAPVKDEILKNVDQIDTHPKWAKRRLYQVLDERTDWTISRQRLWGVPIIAFYDQKNNLVLNNEILNYAINKIEQVGTDAWFSLDADEFLPDQYKNKSLRKEKDILDVWFDSGSSAIALNQKYPNLKLPYDVYLEGNDQYRGWFNASMINSTIYSGISPYKQLVSHGMTTDEKGNKMSKSLGNGVDPIEFSNELGADILRLWVASTDFTDDQKIGKEIIKQISESYRKIRNTIRFILANLNDFNPQTDYQKTLSEVDMYSLANLTSFKNKVLQAYEELNFNLVYTLVMNYVTKNLSAFYLDFIKDILYINSKNDLRRRQVQTVLYEQFYCLIDVLRPILVHTVEEAYQNLNDNKVESVHLLDNREQNFVYDEQFINKWDKVMLLRDDVNKALEVNRENKIINKGFEAIVYIKLDQEYEYLKEIKDLSQIFIVNSIYFVDNIDNDFIRTNISSIKVEQKQGLKCQRCWQIFDNLVDDEICYNCNNVVKSL
ncbi:isoleucine--tRNA ligase [Mycoplasma feriruminatoris]|uniref:isoleucine--tRNA ligase n=1 Tax=Mycoplasma feriruminatoris TaxID=1179777 RepID=UPI0002A4FC71|nr:isoleucine--tRNA ligase [Mycoplasma feriruminatoris]UKS54031.1 isoleucine--tRNA ligase [Mycoplasma feriruminatoris]VZK65198.1 Isoleucine--tRNA ligase [Mycoplasma feriruminatoris]VZR75344.1 Isoleucine--tRNA ligase [Mycoplasma feriruminatoris]VZR97529.1 Isoleucine--tRNA ligase [Mycoplasma feriruminatoris]VZR99943.1 Isoleucine--tRNA ligase [Mycoplasma feriruminatoris]